MINKTSLSHANVQCRLMAAMRKTAKVMPKSMTHNSTTIRNKNGGIYLTCIYLRGAIAQTILGVSSGFLWVDAKGKNVTEIVLKSLRD